ncbi:hypothetical protein ACTFIU_010117 [Dictyostelium citrinum]
MVKITTTNNNCELFFDCWRNEIILNTILFHTRLFNVHSTIKMTIDQYSTYKYKSYIENLIFVNNEEDSDLKINNLIIKELNKSGTNTTPPPPPMKLSELGVKSINDKEGHSKEESNSSSDNSSNSSNSSIFPYSIKSITFSDKFNEPMDNIKFFDSITSLEFGELFNQPLDGDWLPCKIKSLKFGNSFQQTINKNVLPDTLENLQLSNQYKGIIVPGSIPSKVKDLDYVPNLNLNITIPVSSTNLSFCQMFNAIIKEGYIPHNVQNIEFNQIFNREIKPGALPASLRSLKFGGKFNQPLNGNFQVCVLPPNLTNLEFGLEFNQPLTASMLPTSLTSLKFGDNFNPPLSSSSMSALFLHTNLISLEFGKQFKNVIPVNTLPKTLKHLNLGGFDDNLSIIKDSLDCTSLESLILDNFNQYLKPADLPSTLTSLHLGTTFDKPIGKDVLPNNLKVLEIKNSKYSHQLHQINLPKSLDKLIIHFGNVNLLNTFSADYFYSKITKIKN